MIVRVLFILLFSLSFWPFAHAQENTINASKLGFIPIQMDGRVRPLSSLSDIVYQDLTQEKIKHHSKALQFLARVMFDPAEAAEEQIIHIGDPHTIENLGLKKAQRFYSLSNITPALTKLSPDIEQWVTSDPKNLTPFQKEVLELTDKIITLTQIMRSFTAILPLDITPPDDIKNALDAQYYNYLNLISFEEEITKKAQQYSQRGLKNLNAQNLQYIVLSEQLIALRQGGDTNDALRVIPDNNSALYYSPWDLLLSGEASPQSLALLSSWGQLAYAYRQNDQTIFDQTASIITKQSNTIKPYKQFKLTLEKYYLIINPLLLSALLYALSLIAIGFRKNDIAIKLGVFGVIIHGLMLAVRVYILGRPPVATLFESILFVGFLSVLVLYTMRFKTKNNTYAIMATSLGLFLHIIATGFTQNNDSFGLIQAVLNTSFWLMVHVLMISAGYATSLITSVIAQVHLYKKTLINHYNIKVFSGISLLLVTVGTILGGLWADQSWGRFWGWDPKENGALLIILWLSWVMHGAVSGHISQKLYIIGMGALSVIVALAWFGVNLLSIGLHSYGFASGVGVWLFVFITIQSFVLLYLGKHYEQKSTS